MGDCGSFAVLGECCWDYRGGCGFVFAIVYIWEPEMVWTLSSMIIAVSVFDMQLRAKALYFCP